MTKNRRLLILGLILAAVATAAVRLSHGEQESMAVSEPVARVVPTKPSVPVANVKSAEKSELELHRMSRLEISVGEINPFAPKSWFVPPPPPPPQAPEKPSAPPLPFSYVGKLEEDGSNPLIYLLKGNESFMVQKGDTFDNSYRFDGLEKGNLIIQYLPLGTRQILPIGTD